MGAKCPRCSEQWDRAGPEGDHCGACGYTQPHGADQKPAAEEGKDEGPPTQANALISIGKQAQLFHDQLGVTHARFEVAGHLELWPVRSRRFRGWLVRSFYNEHSRAPSPTAVATAIEALDGLAQYDGDEHALHNRVAWFAGSLYYDLTDAAWRAVRITREGWEVVERPPILFRRFSHQKPQVVPTHGGDIRAFARMLNISGQAELLSLCHLVVSFVPDIPHPIDDTHGEKGSGKSVSQKAKRRLIDPSAAETLSFPRSPDELALALDHHYAPIFDNVDTIRAWLSDMLCKAVTGDGFSKRMLYSDSDDVIYSYQRVILLNGINVVAQRPDLLDRTILYRLERIPGHLRKSEQEFWAEFDEAKPHILGAIFDTLSAAIRAHEELKLPRLERMADFTRWGAAVSVALGDGADAFLEAYRANITLQTMEAVEGNLVGAAVLALLEECNGEWSGTPTQFHAALESVAERKKFISRPPNGGRVYEKDWPKNASALIRKLPEISSNLADLGIVIEQAHGDENTIMVFRTEVEGAEITVGRVGQEALTASPDGTDGINGTSTSPAFNIEIA